MSHLIEQLSLPFIRLHISMEVKHKHTFHQGGKNELERHHKIPINRLGITDSRQRRVRRSQQRDNGQDGCYANSHSSVHVLVRKHEMKCKMLIYPILIFISSKGKEQPKGRCLLILDIFSAVCDYAGNVNLNKSYWNPKRKSGVTTHFLKIIHE